MDKLGFKRPTYNYVIFQHVLGAQLWFKHIQPIDFSVWISHGKCIWWPGKLPSCWCARNGYTHWPFMFFQLTFVQYNSEHGSQHYPFFFNSVIFFSDGSLAGFLYFCILIHYCTGWWFGTFFHIYIFFPHIYILYIYIVGISQSQVTNSLHHSEG